MITRVVFRHRVSTRKGSLLVWFIKVFRWKKTLRSLTPFGLNYTLMLLRLLFRYWKYRRIRNLRRIVRIMAPLRLLVIWWLILIRLRNVQMFLVTVTPCTHTTSRCCLITVDLALLVWFRLTRVFVANRLVMTRMLTW